MELIYECEGLFSPDFCSHVIKKFEESIGKEYGMALNDQMRVIKKSLDLPLNGNPYWTDETNHFVEIIKIGIDKYNTFIQNMQVDKRVKEITAAHLENVCINPPQIQKTSPGDYYHWHHDELPPPNPRKFTYIIYLNDVEEDSGGTTEFACGKNIQPKVGKIVFFPSTWTYFHRGKTLEKGVKYIATASLNMVPTRQINHSLSGFEHSQFFDMCKNVVIRNNLL